MIVKNENHQFYKLSVPKRRIWIIVRYVYSEDLPVNAFRKCYLVLTSTQ